MEFLSLGLIIIQIPAEFDALICHFTYLSFKLACVSALVEDPIFNVYTYLLLDDFDLAVQLFEVAMVEPRLIFPPVQFLLLFLDIGLRFLCSIDQIERFYHRIIHAIGEPLLIFLLFIEALTQDVLSLLQIYSDEFDLFI